MKLCQNVCLDEISDEFETGSCGSITRSLGQILEKPCVCPRGLTGLTGVREIEFFFNVRELSGNFVNRQGNVKI